MNAPFLLGVERDSGDPATWRRTQDGSVFPTPADGWWTGFPDATAGKIYMRMKINEDYPDHGMLDNREVYSAFETIFYLCEKLA